MRALCAITFLVAVCLSARMTAAEDSHLDMLKDSDMRQILSEQGVPHMRLRSRAQLMEAMIALDGDAAAGRSALGSGVSGAGHTLKVLYCSG